MQCLYCGKGIGPIRQLRDLEFCSEAHRTQFRERYRQQVYEALAPEPAPVSTADFIGRAPATSGPRPTVDLRLAATPMLTDRIPAAAVERAGVSVERQSWVLSQQPAKMPVRPAWYRGRLATESKPPAQLRFDSLRPAGACLSEGAAASADPVASVYTAGPRAAQGILVTNLPDIRPVWMPGAAQTPAPAAAQAASPGLKAALPANGDPAAAGPLDSPAHATVSWPCNPAIASKATAPAPASVEVALTSAVITSQPRPLEAGPLMRAALNPALDKGELVVFGSSTPKLGMILPKAPDVAASSPWISVIRNAQSVWPEPRVAAAVARATFNLPAPELGKPLGTLSVQPFLALAAPVQIAGLKSAAPASASPSRVTVRIDHGSNAVEPHGIHASPRVACSIVPSKAHAGWLWDALSPKGGLVASQRLRSAVISPALRPASTEPHRATALPGIVSLPAVMDAAPLRSAEAPLACTSASVSPSWEDARAELPFEPQVPKANVALPHVDWAPAPAGSVAEPGKPLSPDLSLLVRSNAVSWTSRLAQICSPAFRVEPIVTHFLDLLNSEQATPYVPDVEEIRPHKPKVRTINRFSPRRFRTSNWQYIGAAAAALLLAGVLIPKTAAKSAGSSLPWSSTSFRQWMSARATRDFADNFRGGLEQWQGVRPKWPKSWSYSRDGFMHPGQLALYRPSVPLSDYRFEFMAQVETKSVDWVVRAKDAENYYALKFTVIQPGPRPIMAMVRYPVIGGRQGSRVETPLRMMIHANTPYKVTVDVKGNKYRAYIEDQVADFWTDDRLKTGGVGFFSEASEHARVYWVKLESHGDILGRICGLLSGEGGAARETQAMNHRSTVVQDIWLVSAAGRPETGAVAAPEARISKLLLIAPSVHLDGKLD